MLLSFLTHISFLLHLYKSIANLIIDFLCNLFESLWFSHNHPYPIPSMSIQLLYIGSSGSSYQSSYVSIYLKWLRYFFIVLLGIFCFMIPTISFSLIKSCKVNYFHFHFRIKELFYDRKISIFCTFIRLHKALDIPLSGSYFRHSRILLTIFPPKIIEFMTLPSIM